MGNQCYRISYSDDLRGDFDWNNESSVRKKTALNSVRNAGLGKEIWPNKTFLRYSDKKFRKSSSSSSQRSRIPSITFADEIKKIILYETEYNVDDISDCGSGHGEGLVDSSSSATDSMSSCIASCASQMIDLITETRPEGLHPSAGRSSASTSSVSKLPMKESKRQHFTNFSLPDRSVLLSLHELPISSIQLKKLPRPSPQQGCPAG